MAFLAALFPWRRWLPLPLDCERLVEQRNDPGHVHQLGQAFVAGVDLRLNGQNSSSSRAPIT
jgi:hypothetical protein